MSELIITGEPILAMTFPLLPSWNDAVRKARGKFGWRSGHAHTKKWERIGKHVAQDQREFVGRYLPFDYVVRKRAMVLVKMFRETARVYDVHNLYLKALFDGFTKAMVWPDDSWPYVPWVVQGWCYQSEFDLAFETFPQRVEIEIHELTRVVLNDAAQILPVGKELQL
jgi:Holliday junction resolvase RusA-like endonuclease